MLWCCNRIKRKRWPLIAAIKSWSFLRVFFAVVCIYVVVGIGFGMLYKGLDQIGRGVVEGKGGGQPGPDKWPDYVYFSFVTQATVGYGEFAGSNWWGKLLCPLQAVLGVLLIAILPAAVIARMWAPDNAVVFANQAELRVDKESKQAFLAFRCFNTLACQLRNVEILCRFAREFPERGKENKLVRLDVSRLPWMASSVWTVCSLKEDSGPLFRRIEEAKEAGQDYQFKVVVNGTFSGVQHSFAQRYKQSKNQLVDGSYLEVDDNDKLRFINKRRFHTVVPRVAESRETTAS